MQSDSTADRRTHSWRISLDRAWRSGPLRRRFESECGLTPLAEAEAARHEQTFSGDVQTYHKLFLLWATKYLGLKHQAPPDIQRRLSSES